MAMATFPSLLMLLFLSVQLYLSRCHVVTPQTCSTRLVLVLESSNREGAKEVARARSGFVLLTSLCWLADWHKLIRISHLCHFKVPAGNEERNGSNLAS